MRHDSEAIKRQLAPGFRVGVRLHDGTRWGEVTAVGARGFSWREVDARRRDGRLVRVRGERRFSDYERTWTSLGPRLGRGYFGVDAGRVLLVGEAPNKWMQETGRMKNALLREDLAALCGVSFPADFFRLFARTNVLDFWPGPAKGGKGSAFPMDQARPAARDLMRQISTSCRFDRMVLMGRRVAEAVLGPGHKDHAWFEWFYLAPAHYGAAKPPAAPGLSVAVAPHPSKISRWWNEAKNVGEAQKFWRPLARFAALNADVDFCPRCLDPGRRDLQPRCGECRQEPRVMGMTRKEADAAFEAAVRKQRGGA